MPWAPLEFETKLKATGKHGAWKLLFELLSHRVTVACVERRWWGSSFTAPLGLLDAHARGPPRVHTLLTLCLPFYSSVPSHVRAVHAHTPLYLRRHGLCTRANLFCAAVSRTNGAPTRRSTHTTVIFAIANPRSYGGERKRTREGLVEGNGTRTQVGRGRVHGANDQE